MMVMRAPSFILTGLLLATSARPETLPDLEKAAAAAPNDAAIQNRLGYAYRDALNKAGFFAKIPLVGKCKAAFARAVALEPANVSYRWCLMEFYRQAPVIAGGGMEAAYAQAAAIKRLDPEAGQMAFSELYSGEGKYDQAFAQFEETLRRSPDDYRALYQTGRLSALTGQRIDAGLAAFQRCLKLTPPPGQPPHAAAWTGIGVLLGRKGDFAAARSAYRAALAEDPHYDEAARNLARLDPPAGHS